MRKVIEILHTESKTTEHKKKYRIVHVLLDDGVEARYYVDGLVDEICVGDLVEVWFSEEYNAINCKKSGKPNRRTIS